MKLPALFILLISLTGFSSARPNVLLLIIADDCTFSNLPLNGGQNAKTPHLDALVKQSLVFDRAYLGMAMCSPCRSELYTGLYPFRNGCAWNHGTVRPNTKSLPHHLQPFCLVVALTEPHGSWAMPRPTHQPNSSFPRT